MRASPRALVISAFLFIGSVIFSVALVEALLRLFPALLPPEVQQLIGDGPNSQGISHPYIGHLQTPNKTFVLSGIDFTATHHVDGYGFRNTWPWPARAEIVAVGDSMTFGQAVADERAWPAILARSLTTSRIINLGLIGAGAQQYLRVYETFGMKLQPKVLLVGLFLRNDFWDDNLFDQWLRTGVGGNYMVWRNFGRPEQLGFSFQEPLQSIRATLRWHRGLLSRRSYLYNLLLHVRGVAKKWAPKEVKIFELPDGTRLELFPGDFASKIEGAQPDRKQFQLTLQSLQRIQSIAGENGTHMLIIFQPSKEEVYIPLLGETLPEPARTLQTELQKLGIKYLDLASSFRRRAETGEKLFFEVDGHPNELGYTLIAQEVLSHLKENAVSYGLKDWEQDSSRKAF